MLFTNQRFSVPLSKAIKIKMNNHLAIFQQYLPESTADYCFNLWKQYQFNFKVTRPRHSKLGDYCFRRDRGHQITVNANLNPYSFLVTYIHEVAHLQTFKQYGNKPEPHGKEWKRYFRKTFQPLLIPEILPTALIIPLKRMEINTFTKIKTTKNGSMENIPGSQQRALSERITGVTSHTKY
jgi:hypothetical protein